MFTEITIRPAVEADQATIESLIRMARINPRNLHWSRFLVAEDRGRTVGVRQIKAHKGGTREVASGVVLPEYRRRGISARLMRAVLAREHGPLYLMCDEKRTRYYERFGFRRMEPSGLPADFHREYRVGRIVTSLLSLFVGRKVRIVPMKRDGHRAWSAHDDLGTMRQPDHAGLPGPKTGATLTDTRKGDRSCTA